jgi:pyruvate/2-oxoglutarate dehydrogenase complex dihydrolipoamide dehydrogenase (E3) component
MTETLRPDLCVIGAGSAGLSLASAAAMMGVSVVLIERGKFGGAGLNSADVPARALMAAAKAAQDARRAKDFGVHLGEPSVDFEQVHEHVREVIGRIAPGAAAARLRALGVRILEGAAKFTSRTTLEVAGTAVQARRFVIATGASPSIPPIRGIETVRALTHETIFDLMELPQHLVVIGGGDSVGIELAQAFRRLGSAVTLLEATTALMDEDPELAQEALSVLRAEGVDVREGIRISHIDPSGTGLALHLEGGTAPIIASHLLVAIGRKPNVDGLGLDAAGVAFDRKGITVGRNLRSSNRRIYAVGDVTGGPQSTPAATYQANLVLRAILFRRSPRMDPAIVPRVTYTDPEIAVVGLTEAGARQDGHKVSVLRWPFAENDRAQAQRQMRGHVKVVCDHKGTVLGAGIVGAQAGELICLWQLAVQKRMKIAEMAEVVLPCPTLSEVSRRAALLSYGPSLRNPWLKRILRLLRLLG